MLSLTDKFRVCLGTDSSPQALGQQTLWVLLALVLEQHPLPNEQTHTIATALEGPALLLQRKGE